MLPQMKNKMIIVGENIKLARLRRKLTVSQVSERADIAPMRLIEIERGYTNIPIGLYLSVLRVLNLEKDIYNIASDDPLGRKLQDIELL